MSKTNSNSITSIFISELNNLESDFRGKMLERFRKSGNEIPDDLIFYDGTHSPLKLKSMGEKEVDIYARVPGKYKIYLMIEVKAGIYEDLQDSQKIKGEYQKTSKAEKIPLFFLIPKAYSHRNDDNFIKENIIEWEEVLSIATSCKDNRIVNQIYDFVELTENENYFDEKSNICNQFQNIEEIIAESIKAKELLDKCLKKIDDKHFNETQYEFGYYWNNDSCFLGFNYVNNNYILSFDIAENEKNTEIGKKDFYFWEGWYFIPFDKHEQEMLTIKDFKICFPKKYLNKIDFTALEELNKIKADKLIDAFVLLNILNETYDTIFEENEYYIKGDPQNNDCGIGLYFDEKLTSNRKFFIGVNPNLKDKKFWFSLALDITQNIKIKPEWYCDEDKEYAYFPIRKEELCKCESRKELIKTLSLEIDKIIKSI